MAGLFDEFDDSGQSKQKNAGFFDEFDDNGLVAEEPGVVDSIVGGVSSFASGTAGVAGDAARGLASGFQRGAGGLERAVEWIAPEGSAIERIAGDMARTNDAFMERNKSFYRESEASQQAREESGWNPRGWVHAGMESVGMMAPGLAAGAVSGPLGMGVTATQFWGDTAQQSYDEAKKARPDLDEGQLIAHANLKGFYEGGIEALQNAIPLGILRKFAPVGSGKIVKEAGGDVAKGFWKKVKKISGDIGKTFSAEAPLETLQEYLGGLEDYRLDLGDEPTLREAARVIGPTFITSMVLGGSASIGNMQHREIIRKNLSEEGIEPEQREASAAAVYGAVKQEDPELAEMFRRQAEQLLRENKPILLKTDAEYKAESKERIAPQEVPYQNPIDPDLPLPRDADVELIKADIKSPLEEDVAPQEDQQASWPGEVMEAFIDTSLDVQGQDTIRGNRVSLRENTNGRPSTAEQAAQVFAESEPTAAELRQIRQEELEKTFSDKDLNIKPSIRRALEVMEADLKKGEIGQRFFGDDGYVTGVKTSNPDWFQKKTLDKYDKAHGTDIAKGGNKFFVDNLLRKVRSGEQLTGRQQDFWAYMQDVAEGLATTHDEYAKEKNYEILEKEGFDLVDEKMAVGSIKAGQTISGTIAGVYDEYTHQGYDKEGNAILKDGVTHKLDPFEQVQVVGIKGNVDSKKEAIAEDQVRGAESREAVRQLGSDLDQENRRLDERELLGDMADSSEAVQAQDAAKGRARSFRERIAEARAAKIQEQAAKVKRNPRNSNIGRTSAAIKSRNPEPPLQRELPEGKEGVTGEVSVETLEDAQLLKNLGGTWKYKFAIGSSWMTANTKDDAVERATATYWKTPESERLTSAQRYDKANLEEFERMDATYGRLSLKEIEQKFESMGGEITGLQKAGGREFDGNGGRRTAAAVSNEGARAVAEERSRLGRYLATKFQPVKQEANKETTPKQEDAAKVAPDAGLQSNKPASDMTAAELLRAAADKEEATESSNDIVTPEEYHYKLVVDAHSGTSNTPSAAGRIYRESFVNTVQGVYDKVLPLAETPRQKEVLAASIEQFKQDYLTEERKALSVRKGVVSSHIAGRSNFNSKQASKRGTALDRAQGRFTKWLGLAEQSVKEAVLNARTSGQKEADYRRAAESARKKELNGHLMGIARDLGTMLTPGMNKAAFRPKVLKGFKAALAMDRQKTMATMSALDKNLTEDGGLEKVLGKQSQVWKTYQQAMAETESKSSPVGDYAKRMDDAIAAGDIKAASEIHDTLSDVDAANIDDKMVAFEQALADQQAANVNQQQNKEIAPSQEDSQGQPADSGLQTNKMDARREDATATTDLAFHQETMRRIHDGKASLAEYKAGFQRLGNSHAELTAEFNAMTKAKIFDALGPYFAYRHKPDKKDVVVRYAIEDLLSDYTLGKSISYTMSSDMKKAHHDAIKKIVDAMAAQDLHDHAEQVAASRAERKVEAKQKVAAIENPQTLDDFHTYIRAKKEEGKSYEEARLTLDPEQRAAYDQLTAEKSRRERATGMDAERSLVSAPTATTGAEIIATKHTRDGYDIFVVKAAERVERDQYKEWLAAAKKMGGWYSKFRGNGAVPGFQFKDRESAEAFQQYISKGDAEGVKAQVQARRDSFADDRSQTAVERLAEMAGRLEEKADAILGQERKANTARRASMAANAEANAADDKAMAKTMRNIAQAISTGKATFLDKIRQKVQVEELLTRVRHAHREMLREQYPSYSDFLAHQHDKPTTAAADYLKFPSYTAYRSDLAKLGRQLQEHDGTKKLGGKLMTVADDVTDAYLEFAKENLHKVSTFAKKDGDLAAFSSKPQAEKAISRSGFNGKAIVLPFKRGENIIILSPSEAMKSGIWQGDNDKRISLRHDIGAEIVAAGRKGIDVPWQFKTAHQSIKRLAGMGIETPAELRAAAREFIALQEPPKTPDKIKELERAMVGRSKDGLDFFPTPEAIADEMVEAAGIEAGMKVLEPSAGWGHIAERIRSTGVAPDVVEMSSKRQELLEAKGFNVVGRDFMDTDEQYDRIIMNPPFSDRRDAEHVQHAYSLLKSGGRVVAIMGEGVFFGQDKKASEFREWLDSVGGTSEKLAEGTFQDASLPVNTGVNARMVVIDKIASQKDDVLYSKTGDFFTDEKAKIAARDQASTPNLFRQAMQDRYGKTGNTVTAVKSELRGFLKGGFERMQRSGKLKIVQGVDKVPVGEKSILVRGRDTVAGAYDPNTGVIALVADNIKPGDAEFVMRHEGLHLLMREDKIFSQQYANILSQFAALQETDTRVQDAFRKVPKDTAKNLVAEEALAYFVQDKSNYDIPLMKRLIANIRMFLVRMGVPVRNMSAEDMLALVTQGVKSMAKKQSAVVKDSLTTAGKESDIRYSKEQIIAAAKAIYSKLEDVAANAFTGMKAQGVKNFLTKQGVKKVEMDAVGIDGFLADKKGSDKVSREELLDFVQANTVELEDVVLGDGTQWSAEEAREFHELDRRRFPATEEGLNAEEMKRYGELATKLRKSQEEKQTHFSQYTEPGAVEGSYREMFVTAPKSQDLADNRKYADQKAKDFFGKTYAELSEGDKGMVDNYIEEYYPTDHGKDKKWSDGHSQYSDMKNPIVRIRFNTVEADGKTLLRIEEMQGPNPENQKKMPGYLKENIYQLGVKRVLAYAKENGFDGVALATKPGMTAGETQADRYSLEKQIDSIEWYKYGLNDEVFGLLITDKEGKKHDETNIKPEKLQDYVGKELAKEIVSSGDRKGEFSGLDLKIGGEGLKTLYDTTLPKMLEKYSGEKMGEVETSLPQDKSGEKWVILDENDQVVRRGWSEDVLKGVLEPGQRISRQEDKVAAMPYTPLTNAPTSYPMFTKDQTKTAAFKSWFKDSKAVDENGNPQIFHHGSPTSFTVFDKNKADSQTGHTSAGLGHFFTVDKSLARRYAADGYGHVMAVYLSAQNPYTLTLKEAQSFKTPQDSIKRQEELQAEGYDSILFEVEGMGRQMIVFDSNQIKSATGNTGEFSSKSDDIMYSRVGTMAVDLVDLVIKDKPRWQERFEKFTYNFLNTNDPRKRIYEVADKKTSKNDMVTIEELRGKKTAEEVARTRESVVEPMLENLAKNKLLISDLEEYSHALHAPERNERMRLVNAKRILDGFIGQMTDSEAGQWKQAMEDVRSNTAMDDAADNNDTMRGYLGLIGKIDQDIKDRADSIAAKQDALASREFTDEEIVKGTPERKRQEIARAVFRLNEIRRMKADWDERSPMLSGLTDKESAEIVAKWENDSRVGALQESKTKLDRINRMAIDALYESGELAEEEYVSIVNGYKNYVPLYRDGFFDTSPTVGRITGPTGKPLKVAMGSLREVVNIVAHTVQNYEAAVNRKHKAAAGQALYQFVLDNPDSGLTIEDVAKKPTHDREGNVVLYPSMQEPENGVFVKVLVEKQGGGEKKLISEKKLIMFDIDQRTARGRTVSRFLDSIKGQAAQLGPMLSSLSKVNRYLSMVNTMLSPEFVLSNFVRDFQTAFIHLSDEKIRKNKGIRKKISNDIFPAIKGIFQAEQGNDKTDMGKWYRDFAKEGGKIGWMQGYEKISDLANELESIMKLHGEGHTTLKKLDVMKKLIASANTSVENGVRLATYKNLVEGGVSKREAASVASKLTVDFTQHGKYGPAINSLYLFANAGIVGNYRMITAIAKSRNVQKIVGGIAIGGFALQLLALIGGGDDDAGEPYVLGLPDFVRERNMIFMIPGTKGKHLSMPMPYGYNIFYNAGAEAANMMYMALLGKNYDNAGSAMRLVTGFGNSFNPLASGTILQTLSPTIADPIVQAAENKNFMGLDLMPKQVPFGPEKPDSERYWKSVSSTSKFVSSTVNRLTGGDRFEGGVVDVSPETLDMLYETVTGSTGRFISNILHFPGRVIMDELEPHKVPFSRRFYGAWNDRAISERYYERIEDGNIAKQRYDGAETLKDKRVISSSPEFSLYKMSRHTETRLRSLRRALRLAESRDDRERVDTLKKRITDLQMSYINKTNNILQ